MKSPSRQQVVDFVVLVLRWYLAYYMFNYGYDKLFDGQFYTKPGLLDQPVREVDRFYLAWHLFSLSMPFNIGVGVTQIIGAVLIVFNPTAIIGGLFLFPVLVNILLIDLSFTMTQPVGLGLVLRLSGMVLADVLILYYYRERLIKAWDVLTNKITTRFKYRWWVYLLLPVLGFLSDFAFAVVMLPIKLLLLKLVY